MHASSQQAVKRISNILQTQGQPLKLQYQMKQLRFSLGLCECVNVWQQPPSGEKNFKKFARSGSAIEASFPRKAILSLYGTKRMCQCKPAATKW
jgi:hypothetical protein